MAAEFHSVTAVDGACRVADVAAYLDGELDPEAACSFETHARVCGRCAGALNEQKRLLCLLDAAFEPAGLRAAAVAPPRDFARVVTARARSDMSRTLRAGSERRRALALCALLAAASAACMLVAGAVLGGATFSPAARFLRAAARVVGVAAHALADAASGLAVILRSLGGQLVPDELLPAKTLAWLLFACGALLLLRRIGGHLRRRRV